MNINAESLGEIELAVVCAVLGAIRKEVMPEETQKPWISFSQDRIP